jgi:hypothetical protein
MEKKDVIKKTYKVFKELTKKGLELYQVEQKTFPQKGELREICANYPIYVVPVEEISVDYQNKIYKTLILTEDVLLGFLNQKTPIIKLPEQKTLLVALPTWIYLNEKFFVNYTYKRAELDKSSIEILTKYAEKTSIPKDLRGEYINSIMKLLSPYNTYSILNTLDVIEELGITRIRIPDHLKKYFEEKFSKKN